MSPPWCRSRRWRRALRNPRPDRWLAATAAQTANIAATLRFRSIGVGAGLGGRLMARTVAFVSVPGAERGAFIRKSPPIRLRQPGPRRAGALTKRARAICAGLGFRGLWLGQRLALAAVLSPLSPVWLGVP